MENISRPWVWLLSAGDWINLRERFLDVIIFIGTLLYCINLSHKYVSHHEYRLEILGCPVKIYLALQNLDYLSICQCLMFLDEPETVARILDKLIFGSQDGTLLAYQTAFNLAEDENQAFFLNMRNHLDALSSARAKPDSSASTEPSADVQMGDDMPNGSALTVDPNKVAYDRLEKKIKNGKSTRHSIPRGV